MRTYNGNRMTIWDIGEIEIAIGEVLGDLLEWH